MKHWIPIVLGLGLSVATLWVSHQRATHQARQFEAERAAWEAERANLETALAAARAPQANPSPVIVAATPKPAAGTAPKANPQELLHGLASMKVTPGPGQARATRQILATLDQLVQVGPDALPTIRLFLNSNADVEYEALAGKGMRDIRSVTDAVLPPSLRLALFDVVRQIGGDEAEKLLAETLSTTGRGIELACLTQLLEEMASGKYREAAVAAAQALLLRGLAPGADRVQRDYLFGVLRRFNDGSFVSSAQAQVLQADGRVDRSALRYLQQSLGEQSVPIAAQLYKDGRITEADSREPLARVALAYVGATGNEQAVQLFHTAINDPTLKPAQRRELVLDLDQDGLQNDKTPTATDLPIVANRLALTQSYLEQDYVRNDPLLQKAFLEANKDLQKLLERGTAAAANAGAGAAPPGKRP